MSLGILFIYCEVFKFLWSCSQTARYEFLVIYEKVAEVQLHIDDSGATL